VSKPVFCLMGPTAAGKTALACELVQQCPFEIISVDSAMIYRGLNIGAAKPDADTLARAPHHLIDRLDPNETYSAARCVADINALIHAINQRGKIPLLVGGTMMYFRALQQGLATLPDADVAIRERLSQQAAKLGWPYLHHRLSQIDAPSAAKIHPHDTQRIQRALEVYELTHTPMSTLWQQANHLSTVNYINLAIMPDDRSWLHARIAERFRFMLAEGLIQEVEHLVNTWSLTPAHPSMRSVGYRQVLAHLQDEYDYAELIDKGIAATRQLAKRQLTWLRHWPDTTPFRAENPTIEQEVIAFVKQILDNS
jgi:tRNA dimethylallyltransferase